MLCGVKKKKKKKEEEQKLINTDAITGHNTIAKSNPVISTHENLVSAFKHVYNFFNSNSIMSCNDISID